MLHSCLWLRGKLINALTSNGNSEERLGAGIMQLRIEDPNTLLSCGYDTSVRLWDLRTRLVSKSNYMLALNYVSD